MYYEKWGFMLIFWNMAGVPLSYCHCTIFLANHDPSEYAWPKPILVFLYLSYVFAYWVWDTANSQKNMFRSGERGYQQHRKTFPQLPWKYIRDPQTIKSDAGDSLLCDGWYKYARKIHYTADLYFAVTWGLITGFRSPFPWFYPMFFSVMIVHRAYRDIQRCKEKYGTAWEEYERRVPYLFIPVSHASPSNLACVDLLTYDAVCILSLRCLEEGDSSVHEESRLAECCELSSEMRILGTSSSGLKSSHLPSGLRHLGRWRNASISLLEFSQATESASFRCLYVF